MYLHSKLDKFDGKINIAFIGCGKFISMFLAQYNQLKKIKIDTIIDLDLDRAKSNCLKSIKNQKPVIIYHNGNQIRDFLFIDDAVQGIVKTLQTPLKGFNILNISSGEGIQIKKFLRLIESISKRKIPVKFSSQKFDKKNLFANNTKAKNLINFIPEIKIKEGLKECF